MDHFQGVVANEKWKNDILNELRKNNELLTKLCDLLGRDAQAPKTTTEKRSYRKRSVG